MRTRSVLTLAVVLGTSLLTPLAAFDRTPSTAGTMAIEATTNFGYNLKTQQSGFSQNFYLYFVTQLMDWTKIDVNKEGDGPAGYIVLNGGSFNLVQNLDQKTAAAQWSTMSPDIGWDRFSAGLTMFPYYLEMFRYNYTTDTTANPDPVPDFAALEGVMDRPGAIDGLNGRFPTSRSAVRAPWTTSGGFELGAVGPKADLGLIVASRNDPSYTVSTANQGTYKDQRNNYVVSGVANLKKALFLGLPVHVQMGAGATNFTERQDIAGGARGALDLELPWVSGGISETFAAFDVLTSAYHSDNPALPGGGRLTDWEASAGTIAFFSPNESWKQNRIKAGTKGNSPWAFSSGNHYSNFWRRWHDYGGASAGYPGISATAQISSVRTSVAGVDGRPATPTLNAAFQAWEWDAKEGADKNWGYAAEVVVNDLMSGKLDHWKATGYLSYRTDDDMLEPYGYASWGQTAAVYQKIVAACGLTLRPFDNAAFDVRWSSSDLSPGSAQDPGLFNASLLVYY